MQRNSSTRRRRRRSQLIERLESRFAFSVDSVAFEDSSSLTFSIPGDGTPVGLQLNQWQAAVTGMIGTTDWQSVLARSLQTWANTANVNFGFVIDDASPLGVYGPVRSDARFGDLRFAAIESTPDTYAEAISENTFAAGSWAGDVLLNTKAPISNAVQLNATLLHELGHVLGLSHRTETDSVMFAHAGANLTELSARDIADVVARHGPRGPDANEGQHGNNDSGRATRLRGSDHDTSSADGFNGTQTWVHFGGLHAADDVDYFDLQTAIGYQGPLAFEVRTQGISLAKLKVQLEDRHGNVLDADAVDAVFGDVARLEIPNAQADERYYLRIEGGSDAFWNRGDYAVTATTPARFASEGASIADWTRSAHRWFASSDETLSGFSYQLLAGDNGDSTLIDDGNTNDDAAKATRIDPVIQTPEKTVQRIVGSLSNGDHDFFRVRSPATFTGTMEWTVTVESLEISGLIPSVALLDTTGSPVSAEVRVNGNGTVMLVAKGLQLNRDYTVSIRSNPATPDFATGNYVLTSIWSAPQAIPIEFAAGDLADSTVDDARFWYVARPQLFALSLEGSAVSGQPPGVVWATIFNAGMQVVSAIATTVGEVRSAPAVLLQPGAYYLQIGRSDPTPNTTPIHYRLFGSQPSEPVGPLLGDPHDTPYYNCIANPTLPYCYPSGMTTTSTYTVTNPYVPVTNPPAPNPNPNPPRAPAPVALPLPKPSVPVKPPVDGYFWNNQFGSTNPVDPHDANGDGAIGPLDALLVINHLNRFGVSTVALPPNPAEFFDVDGDGRIAPADALVIINFINRK